jgi:hypothetical protein
MKRRTACSLLEELLPAVLCMLPLLVVLCNETPASAQSTSPQAVARDLIGDWQGAVGKQHMGLRVEASDSGGLKVTLLLPDQNAALPFDSAILQTDGTLRLVLKQTDSTYTGKLSSDKSTIEGTMSGDSNFL